MLTLFLSPSYAFTKIGSPSVGGVNPDGSQVVLLRVKVIECFKNVEEAEAAYSYSIHLEPHTACGEGYAHILEDLKESARSGGEQTFKNDENIPYIIYQPKVFVEKGHFIVKPTMEKHMITKQSHIILSLSKIIEDHIKATIAVDIDKIALNDHTAYYKGDQTYVNQTPVRFKRIMTTSETFKIGETKILSGDMWREGYAMEKNVLPEHSRLWLEVTIK